MDTTWEATIGEGTLVGDVTTTRLQDVEGLSIAHGTCPQVSIGGHATIGGLVGPRGSTLDHIRDVDVVLSNGTIARPNESQNPDLYFAIRGAEVSIGSIVTEFVFITHPEPGTTVRFSYTFKSGNAQALAETFAKWQSFISNTPNLDRKLALILIVTPAGIVISGAVFFVALLFSYQNPRTRNDGHLRRAV
jgi:FAD/FMN-containing dehydrogenase